jgi:hypothetical protein
MKKMKTKMAATKWPPSSILLLKMAFPAIFENDYAKTRRTET